MVPDQFSHLLEEIHKLETELGHLPQKWKVLWDKLELPNTDSLAVSRNRIFTKNSLY
jgi:myotubularin-related protein 5/13